MSGTDWSFCVAGCGRIVTTDAGLCGSCQHDSSDLGIRTQGGRNLLVSVAFAKDADFYRNIGTIRRRQAWLTDRVAAAVAEGKAVSHDQTEVNALGYVLGLLEGPTL